VCISSLSGKLCLTCMLDWFLDFDAAPSVHLAWLECSRPARCQLWPSSLEDLHSLSYNIYIGVTISTAAAPATLCQSRTECLWVGFELLEYFP
jgi:hypothetical protein